MSPGIVAESDLQGNLTAEYVFFDGRRVARKDFPSNAVSYYFSDELKTASVITDSAGNIKSDSDFYPWGGELQLLNNDSNHYKYGGHERDGETGLDYMLARYYSNPLGRFLTPDWDGHPTEVPYANFGNPQSLNLYTYGKNNPTTFGDPDGHDTNGLAHGVEDFDQRMDPIYRWVAKALQHPAVQAILEVVPFVGGAGKGAAGAAEAIESGTTRAVEEGAAGAAGSAASKEVNAAAKATADAAQAGGRESGTAAAIRTKDGEIITGTSAGKGGTPGPNHPEVQKALDNVPKGQQSQYHGACAEIACLNAAKNAGKDVSGATSATAKIRKPGHPSHGQPNPPCSTCAHVQKQLRVTPTN
jgi:RHS repeat-associated protein